MKIRARVLQMSGLPVQSELRQLTKGLDNLRGMWWSQPRNWFSVLGIQKYEFPYLTVNGVWHVELQEL